MTLSELLKTLPPDKKIRIGTRFKGFKTKNSLSAGGFVYDGLVCDFHPLEIEDKYIESLLSKITDIMMKRTKDRKPANVPLTNIVNRFCEIVPWMDREIIETYRGQFEPRTTVIIVPGAESFFWYSPDVPDLTADTIDDSAVRNLIDAVYKDVATEYVYQKDPAKAAALARWIKSDPYGILDEPGAIVDACRMQRRKRK